MRRPQRNNKPLFLGVGREGERPDALPGAANVRRMNGIVPLIDRISDDDNK